MGGWAKREELKEGKKQEGEIRSIERGGGKGKRNGQTEWGEKRPFLDLASLRRGERGMLLLRGPSVKKKRGKMATRKRGTEALIKVVLWLKGGGKF